MDELRTITRPYTKAVFDLAVSSGTLTEWAGFLKQCSELLDNNENIIEETFTDNNGKFEFTVFTDEEYILIGEKENEFWR